MAVCLNAVSVPPVMKEGRDFTTPMKRYPYVIVRSNETVHEFTDSLFYSISRKVIFPVNKYKIPEDADFRREIEGELMPYMNAHNMVLDRIIVRGAASPEGPVEWNEFLAVHRADALVELIEQNSRFKVKRQPQVVLMPEDYNYLLYLMQGRGDKYYDYVESVVKRWSEVNVHVLKEKLQQHDSGRLWRHLLDDYFPELRAARVIFVFKKFTPVSSDKSLAGPPVLNPLSLTPPDTLPKFDFTFEPLPRRELLSVKTNLLYDLAYMPGYDRFCPIPNVAIEYYPLHGHFTFGASLDFPWWQDYNAHKYFQVRNYQLEARYYFKSGDVRERGYGNGAAFRGWYLQAYAQAGLYDICFDAGRGWEGEGLGAGLGFGYVLPLSKNGHWRLEFGAQFGYLWTQYDPYQWQCPVDPTEGGDLYYYKWTGKPEDFKKRQYRFNWIGPTRLGITLSYDLLYRKR